MAYLFLFSLLLASHSALGFAPSAQNCPPSRPTFSRLRSVGSNNVNVAEHELPFNQTSSKDTPAALSDAEIQLVQKYRQLLAKKFPATMVRHTMAKEGNDKPELLRSVFEELGDDNKIDEITKPAEQVKKKTGKVTHGQTYAKPKYEDPTGFFPSKSSGGGYVPAGLTEEEYTKIKKKESDDKVGKNYGGWGPRFNPSDKPVADDMAWMAMPDLWTGQSQEESSGRSGSSESSDIEDDPELPLHDPAFLSESKPWIHADAKRSDIYLKGWRTTYKRFCSGETVQQLMLDVVSAEKAVRQILEGIVFYGAKDVTDGQTCIDLNRIGIFSPPNQSDWLAMERAERKIFGELDEGITDRPDEVVEDTNELLLCGKVSRSDFLREIIQIDRESKPGRNSIDILESFSEEDLQEMGLCMDWFISLRRIGISNPFD